MTTQIINQPPVRMALSELQNMVIVVICDVDAKDPRKKVVGWTEDLTETADILIHEPLYFIDMGVTQSGAAGIMFEAPHKGLPETLRFSIADEVYTYEGISDFGSMYIQTVEVARKHRAKFEIKWGQVLAPAPTAAPAIKR